MFKVLKSLLFSETRVDYQALSKKDDNFGWNQVENWKSQIDSYNKIHRLKTEKINTIANKIVSSLGELYLDRSNIEEIKQKLKELGVQSDRCRKMLIEKIRQAQLQCEYPNIKNQLITKLIVTYSKNI